MSTLIILGTARGDSNTLKAVKDLAVFSAAPVVSLHEHAIYPYTYSAEARKEDDFLPIVNQMIQAETIVFATPVYWYAMSGVMKTFFDRFSELITTSKPLGRAFKGKNVYLVSTGSSPELPFGFEVPFRDTAEYFDMNYQQCIYKQMK